MKYCLIIAVLLLLNACASAPSVSIQDDGFSNIEISGPGDYASEYNGIFREWWLRSAITRDTHTHMHELYVHLQYTDFRQGFLSAFDDSGQMLRVVKMLAQGRGCNSHTVKCEVNEHIGVIIPDAYLEAHIHTPYRIKILARTGKELILPITPEMIRLQLDAVSKYPPIKK